MPLKTAGVFFGEVMLKLTLDVEPPETACPTPPWLTPRPPAANEVAAERVSLADAVAHIDADRLQVGLGAAKGAGRRVVVSPPEGEGVTGKQGEEQQDVLHFKTSSGG